MTIRTSEFEAILRDNGFAVSRSPGRLYASRRDPAHQVNATAEFRHGGWSIYLSLPKGGVCASVPSEIHLRGILAEHAPLPLQELQEPA